MPASKGNVRKRPSGAYQVNWLDGHGQRRFRTFQKRRDADAFLRQVQAESDLVRAGMPEQLVPPTRRTWADLVDLWETRKASKRTIEDDRIRIRLHLTPVLKNVAVDGFGPDDVVAVERALLAKERKGQLSVSTRRKVLSLLKAMLRLALRQDWIRRVPHIELPEEPVHEMAWIRSEEEVRRFLEAARATGYPGLVETYATALGTGLRAGELISLDWTHVDLEHRFVEVVRGAPDAHAPKDHEKRIVPIADDLAELLRAWREVSPARDVVFPNLEGKRQRTDARAFRAIFFRCLEDAKLPRMTFHALRHTFASLYMKRGGNVYRLQKLMGHQSVNTTQRYAHFGEGEHEEDRARMAGLFGG